MPQSQPPKSSNKSHKKIDINQKGANKEGTDMDAFNDNGVTEHKETVTANNLSTINTTTNDIVNANSHLTNNVSAMVINNTKDVSNSVNNEINNKKPESNDLTNNSSNATIKSTPSATPSSAKPKINKVDVTSIVREQPKIPMKPLPNNNNTSTDETDRVAPGIDILNANNINKVTSKMNSEQTANNNITSKSNSENMLAKLPYQEGKVFHQLS